jgi:LacI family transcriptional regulator
MNAVRRTSLRDIALAAGVGRTTVSLALRDDPRLPPRTRERIQALARRLGYALNPLVSSVMAMHRTTAGRGSLGTLGFLTAFPSREGWRNSTSERYHAGAAARAAELGYRLETFWAKEPGMTSRRLTAVLKTRGVEGLVVAALPRAVGHVSLDWSRFAAACLAYTMRRPELHRAAHHHFEGVQTCLRILRRRGYRRVGLALAAAMDDRVYNLWKAGFLVGQERAPSNDRVPPLRMERSPAREFAAWLHRHRPNAILGADLVVLDWLKDLGLKGPDDVAFAHLDWSSQMEGTAGIDQQSELVGAAAVDQVVNQLIRGERGVPAHPTVLLVEGSWVEADTARLRTSPSRSRALPPLRA